MRFSSILERTSSYFFKGRYGYETPSPRMPSDGKIRGTYGLADAVNAVRSVILDKHPDWGQQYKDRKSFL